MKRLATILACVFLAPMAGALADVGEPLRVCADPDNLPFTSNAPGERGIYLDLAQHIADQLGRPMTPVWSPMNRAKRMIRTLLLGRQCDIHLGVPAGTDYMAPRVIVSDPIADVGYALVTSKDATATDVAALGGKRVAVQHNTPGQNLVAEHDALTAVTIVTAEEGMQALADHRADAAVLWGPEAGYLNRAKYGDAYRVLPLNVASLQFKAGIAFSARDKDLRDRINAALAEDKDFIRGLAEKYAFPGYAKIAASEARPAAASETTKPEPAAAAETSEASPAADPVAHGRTIFNSICFHCHGLNAITNVERQNLRHLQHRHGEDMEKVFLKTVSNGRPAKGMPAWKEVYSDEDFQAILAYLRGVQEP